MRVKSQPLYRMTWSLCKGKDMTSIRRKSRPAWDKKAKPYAVSFCSSIVKFHSELKSITTIKSKTRRVTVDHREKHCTLKPCPPQAGLCKKSRLCVAPCNSVTKKYRESHREVSEEHGEKHCSGEILPAARWLV